MAEAVRESLDEVRRIARELRPEALDDLGLVNALIALCPRVEAQEAPGGARAAGEAAGAAPDVELVIYRIAQEASRTRCGTPGAERAPSRSRRIRGRLT